MILDLDGCYITGDQKIYEGQNISLTCDANGYPYPTFTWYLQGQQLRTSSRIRIQGSQLNIFNATSYDDGEYKCVASNQAGQVSHGVDVAVRDFPPVDISTNTRKYIVVGTEIRFRCHGIDQFYIRHIQRKMELVKGEITLYEWRRLWNNSITPTYHARQNYTGRYRCKATIGAASRYSPPLYLIVGIPSGPVVLEKKPETSTTGIKLSWKPVSNKFWNGEQVTFEVNVSSVAHVWQKSRVTKATSALISGLLPTTTYIVSIRGRTVFGSFQNVTLSVVKTKENKNSKKFLLQIRLTNHEFSKNLLDTQSSQYKNLKTKLEDS
ncbi:neural cell adhesion molecule L1 isoform X1, partial [Paramuricea clavata]